MHRFLRPGRAGRRGGARRARVQPRGAGRGRAGSAAGQDVSAECCPHHLVFDERRYEGPDAARFAMTPPLRARRRTSTRCGRRWPTATSTCWRPTTATCAWRRRRAPDGLLAAGVRHPGRRPAPRRRAYRRRGGGAADAGAARRGGLHGPGAALRPRRPQGRVVEGRDADLAVVGSRRCAGGDDAGVVDASGYTPYAGRRAARARRATCCCAASTWSRRRARRRRAARPVPRRGPACRAARATSTARWPPPGRGGEAARGPHRSSSRAAPSGLGRAMCLAFAGEGAHVVVGDVRREPREGGEPTDALIADGGRLGDASCRPTCASLADVDALVDAALELGGRLDVMVPNAVLAGPHSKGLLETERGRLERDARRRPDRRLPLLPARRAHDARAGADRRGARPAHPHLLAARHGRHAGPRRVLRDQGRHRQPHAPARRRLRPPRHPRQRDRAGQDPDGAARRAGHAGGPRLLARPHAVPAPRPAPRTSRTPRSSWPPTSRATSAARTSSSTAAGWPTEPTRPVVPSRSAAWAREERGSERRAGRGGHSGAAARGLRAVAAADVRPPDADPPPRRDAARVGRRRGRARRRPHLRLDRRHPPAGVRAGARRSVPALPGAPHGVRRRRGAARAGGHDGAREPGDGRGAPGAAGRARVLRARHLAPRLRPRRHAAARAGDLRPAAGGRHVRRLRPHEAVPGAVALRRRRRAGRAAGGGPSAGHDARAARRGRRLAPRPRRARRRSWPARRS